MSLHRNPELRRPLLALVVILLPAWAQALPEDDAQRVESENFASIEGSLDQGVLIQKGHPGMPTCITQGSRVICGDEIRIERADGSLKKVTATGTPATFQQQPEVNKGIVHFSGLTLVFDNEARLVTLDGDAKFSQDGNELAHHHIEYHLDTRIWKANQGDTEEQGHMQFTPPPAAGE
jgi:lipopolysaccharide export system protein LptA